MLSIRGIVFAATVLLATPLLALDFPGPAPGPAAARLDGDRLQMENASLRVTWDLPRAVSGWSRPSTGLAAPPGLPRANSSVSSWPMAGRSRPHRCGRRASRAWRRSPCAPTPYAWPSASPDGVPDSISSPTMGRPASAGRRCSATARTTCARKSPSSSTTARARSRWPCSRSRPPASRRRGTSTARRWSPATGSWPASIRWPRTRWKGRRPCASCRSSSRPRPACPRRRPWSAWRRRVSSAADSSTTWSGSGPGPTGPSSTTSPGLISPRRG